MPFIDSELSELSSDQCNYGNIQCVNVNIHKILHLNLSRIVKCGTRILHI